MKDILRVKKEAIIKGTVFRSFLFPFSLNQGIEKNWETKLPLTGVAAAVVVYVGVKILLHPIHPFALSGNRLVRLEERILRREKGRELEKE